MASKLTTVYPDSWYGRGGTGTGKKHAALVPADADTAYDYVIGVSLCGQVTTRATDVDWMIGGKLPEPDIGTCKRCAVKARDWYEQEGTA
jgi:hypothetical protein